jgi:hypothetical protein
MYSLLTSYTAQRPHREGESRGLSIVTRKNETFPDVQVPERVKVLNIQSRVSILVYAKIIKRNNKC